MEVTKNIYIDNSRNLQLEVTIGQPEQVDSMRINIYNYKSFIDDKPIFSINVQGNHYEGTITESNINAMNSVLNDSYYTVDLHHSLIIVVVTVEYNPYYSAQQPCCDSGVFTFATYYPCTIYNKILPTVRELEQECNAVPMNFIDGLLKKKAIDVCIEAGHFEQACKYWCKFYTQGGSTIGSSSSGGGCGCHG